MLRSTGHASRLPRTNQSEFNSTNNPIGPKQTKMPQTDSTPFRNSTSFPLSHVDALTVPTPVTCTNARHRKPREELNYARSLAAQNLHLISDSLHLNYDRAVAIRVKACRGIDNENNGIFHVMALSSQIYSTCW
jgi:hypothetical protein